MSGQELKDRLRDLHNQLNEQAPIDAELRTLLLTVEKDIEEILERQGGGPSASDTIVSDRVRQMSANFAVKHPHLEPIFRDLTELLARMGI